MSPGAAGVSIERFVKQLFGARLVLLHRGAPTLENIADKNIGDTDPRIDRARIDGERPFEGLEGLPQHRCRERARVQRSPAHDQIPGIGIEPFFLFEPLSGRSDEVRVERASEPPGDLALRLREVAKIGLEPIRPQMRAAFGVDQLHIDLDLAAKAPHAAF